MNSRRDLLTRNGGGGVSRRQFLSGSAAFLAGGSLLGGCTTLWSRHPAFKAMQPCGPGAGYTPTIRATFVRRREEYGFYWPGAVYDGQAARRKYTRMLKETARKLGVNLQLRERPIYSLAEAEAWASEAKAGRPDGLMVVVLDRQKHSWPSAARAVETGIPTVILTPLGTSFTVNTAPLANKQGCVIYSSEDLQQGPFGMKMLQAGAKIRNSRCIVIIGDERFDSSIKGLGITLRHIPGREYLDEYHSVAVTKRISALADDYLRRARKCRGATRQDVINGVRAYVASCNLLRREGADAITMACLRILHDSGESLPCLAWSRLNDEGIPAACEADTGAVASHMIVQRLFDRPGFQQDPVADTADNALIGSHCTCATRLRGFDQPPEPFDIRNHHANRDATTRTIWKKGQRITSIDVLPGSDSKATGMLISAGTVLDNVSVPPNGGCVVSVKVRFDGDQDVLTFPGFHHVFFYGDYKPQVRQFCQLFAIKPQVV